MDAAPSQSAELIWRGLAFGLLGVVLLSGLIWVVYRIIIARIVAGARERALRPHPIAPQEPRSGGNDGSATNRITPDRAAPSAGARRPARAAGRRAAVTLTRPGRP